VGRGGTGRRSGERGALRKGRDPKQDIGSWREGRMERRWLSGRSNREAFDGTCGIRYVSQSGAGIYGAEVGKWGPVAVGGRFYRVGEDSVERVEVDGGVRLSWSGKLGCC